METAVLAENEVFFENVKTTFNNDARRYGYMTIEEGRRLCHESINKRRELLKRM